MALKRELSRAGITTTPTAITSRESRQRLIRHGASVSGVLSRSHPDPAGGRDGHRLPLILDRRFDSVWSGLLSGAQLRAGRSLDHCYVRPPVDLLLLL